MVHVAQSLSQLAYPLHVAAYLLAVGYLVRAELATDNDLIETPRRWGKGTHKPLVTSSNLVVATRQASRANGTHQRLFARALGVDLLLLDDFGLQPLGAQAVQDLYDIISERYEHGSIILTSNRAFEEWAEPFANDLLASAALDRLTHHAHTLIIRGQSYRQRLRRKEEISSTA